MKKRTAGIALMRFNFAASFNKKSNDMRKLSKRTKSYKRALKYFRKQYKDVQEITALKLTADNKVCGGEWLNSEGVINIADSLEFDSTVIITN